MVDLCYRISVNTMAHYISLMAQEGGDISIISLNIPQLEWDVYLDDIWRFCQDYEAELYIDIYLKTGRDYISYKTKDDIIFHEIEMFKTNISEINI